MMEIFSGYNDADADDNYDDTAADDADYIADDDDSKDDADMVLTEGQRACLSLD